MTRSEFEAQGHDFNDLSTIMPALHCVLDGYMDRREEGILREFVFDELVEEADNFERQSCAYAMITALMVIERKFIGDNDIERDLILEVLVELGPAGVPTLEKKYQKVWRTALSRREMERIVRESRGNANG